MTTPKNPKTSPTAIHQVRLAKAVDARLRELSRESGLPVASLVRRLVESRVTGKPDPVLAAALKARSGS